MKTYALLMFICLVVNISADCGCLKCSKHLQGVSIPGPAGFPVKVIFRKPTCSCSCGGTCECCGGKPDKPDPYKCQQIGINGEPGKPYSASIQVPLSPFPRRRLPLKNLKYRTDAVLVPPQNPNAPSSCVNPRSLTTADILNWLRNVHLTHCLAAQKEARPTNSITPTYQTAKCPECQCPTCPCAECQARQGNNPLDVNLPKSDKTVEYSGVCPRSKRSTASEENLEYSHCLAQTNPTLDNLVCPSRSKRDLGKQSYDFLMKMLPQSVREPLHHSLRGTNYLQKSNPALILKDKVNDLKLLKNSGLNGHYHRDTQDGYYLPHRLSSLSQVQKHHFQELPKVKKTFLNQDSDYFNPSYLNGLKKTTKNYLADHSPIFGNSRKISKFPIHEAHPLQDYSIRPSKNSRFEISNIPIHSSNLYVNPLSENNYKPFLQKQKASSVPPILSQRHEDKKDGDEKTLLRKLKKLNNNPYTSNLEDQATIFVQHLLNPEESNPKKRKSSFRSRRSVPETDLTRKKRTIILGSDEIDLPTHYEVEMVSVEDESREHVPEEYEYVDEDYGEYEDEEPILGDSPYMRKSSPPRKFYPSRPRFSPKPEVVMGKNVIQKAVREELNAYHKKVTRDQKFKEMQDALKKKQQKTFIPQNPIFSILTAPIKFLKHLSGMNRGGGSVLTSIPKLVYTTKRVFKDLGRDIHRNCLDLASNVIGDFDHVDPSVVQQVMNTDGRRYRRDVAGDELRSDFEENASKDKSDSEKNDVASDMASLTPVNKSESNRNNATDNILMSKEGSSHCFLENETLVDSYIMRDAAFTNATSNPDSPTNSSDLSQNYQVFSDSTSDNLKNLLNTKPNIDNFAPDYSLSFKNSKETQNFRHVPDKHVRKKRYVIKVVDDDEIHDQVQDIFKQKYGHGEYQNPLEKYYDTVDGFLGRLWSNQQPKCQYGDDCYYEHTPSIVEEYDSDESDEYYPDSDEESYEERPKKKKKLVIRKVKPKVIIDRKGIPFMDYKGYKRPLISRTKKHGLLRKTKPASPKKSSSSEETGSKIAIIIARAKEDSEVVGSSHKDVVPHQILKERISSLLEEVDQLVHLNAENYDEIFDKLIRVQQIKTSLERDWKQLLMNDRVDDISAKIGLLSKFKDLQYAKDDTVKNIAAALKKNDNEFVRCQLVNSLLKLQKLQALITNVVDEFERNLKMKTSFNAKKEIKYVDYLSEIDFVSENTRHDLIKKLSKDRDVEGQKDMDTLHKLKALLATADSSPEKLDEAAKLLWEMKNLEKLQIETINDMNKKLSKNYTVKKELKILFDLQRRFEDCNNELSDYLSDTEVKGVSNKIGHKKDVAEIIAEAKKKREEMLQRIKERKSISLKKS